MEHGSKMTEMKQGSRKKQVLEEFPFTPDLLPVLEDDLLTGYHQSAWEAYQTLPFPNRHDEPWRRTDISGLETRSFTLSPNSMKTQQAPKRFLNPDLNGNEFAGQVVCSGEKPISSLDKLLQESGVIFSDFHNAEVEHPHLVKSLVGKVVAPDEDKFTALAAALASDGVFLYVPKDVVIEKPLHSLFWGAGNRNTYINHLLVWLEEGAQATFIHETASVDNPDESQVLHDGIVEIHVGRNARLSFIELQSWGRNVWSFTRERARVMGDGSLEWIYGGMGTRLTKNFSDIDLVEPGAEARISGF
jgi:Fe-S cluster assembly protein SufD